MKEEIPQSIKDLQTFWNSPIYKKAAEYSETLWKTWNLGDLVAGDPKKRLQILAQYRNFLAENPSDFDFSLVVGLIHESVSALVLAELPFGRKVSDVCSFLRQPPTEKDDPESFLRAVIADILLHFPYELKDFLEEGSILDEEFSVRWLYILHSGIARASGRCLQYLNIHVPEEMPPRYYPAFPPISVPPRSR